MCRFFLQNLLTFGNIYLLAKFGFDTAENEPCEVAKFSRPNEQLYRAPPHLPRRAVGRAIPPPHPLG